MSGPVLRACPFCGGRADVASMHHGTMSGINAGREEAVFVRCRSCAAEGPWVRAKDLADGSIAAAERWNRRSRASKLILSQAGKR